MINDLNLLISTLLNSIKTEYGIKEIGYRVASDQKAFPHVVYEFVTGQPTDMGRQDLTLDIDVWSRSEYEVFNIMDAIKDLMSFRNDPALGILPTFYEVSSGTVEDQDKTLVHGIVRYECQVYDEDATDYGILSKTVVEIPTQEGVNNGDHD